MTETELENRRLALRAAVETFQTLTTSTSTRYPVYLAAERVELARLYENYLNGEEVD